GRGDTPRVRGRAAGAAANARALAKLLFTPPDARTALRGRLGVPKRVAWTGRLDLALVKATARAQGASVNDVLLAAVSGALRRHLRERGERPRAVRTLVPFNLRPLEEPIPRALGNRFGLVFLTLPVDVAGTRERLRELGRRMAAIKDSREGPVSFAILQGIGMTPRRVERRIVDIFTAKASAMTTNVPGPREVVYMAGAPLRAVLVWAPVSGSVGITVSIFSYHDGVTIGLLVDAGLVLDPQTIARDTELELADLAQLEPIAEIVRR
ncbi:MAG: WS/DGAT domain-containing protein, partial [Solirubrobacterales bacterium]